MNIKGCNDCPFHSYYYDDFGIGDQDVHTCELNERLNKNKSEITMKNWISSRIKINKKGLVKSINKYTLDNCQLLQGEIYVTLNKE